MANYYQNFSFQMTLAPGHAAWLMQNILLFSDPEHTDYEYGGGFNFELSDQTLFIYDGDGENSAFAVSELLTAFVDANDVEDPICFEWANTASGHRSDGFGGGAVVITKGKTRHLSTTDWCNQQVADIENAKERRGKRTRAGRAKKGLARKGR